MDFLKELWNYFLLSAPYLILGFSVSGILHVFVSIKQVKEKLGANSLSSVLLATILGIPLPLCSCAVIPMAISLKKSGASNAATSSFLIATPETGVDSLSLTYGLLGLPMMLLRFVSAFISGTAAGLLQMFFNPETKENSMPEESAKKGCCPGTKAPEKTESKFLGMIKYGFGELSDNLALWLSIGILGGAILSYFVPEDFFLNASGWGARLLVLAIGVPFYICASASTPIALSLMLKGMSPGTALILLMVGPATNFSNLAVLQKYIGIKGVALNVLGVSVVALIMSFVTDGLFSHFSWAIPFSQGMHEHGEESSLVAIICAIFLLLLLVKGIWNEEIRPRLNKEEKHCH